MRLRDYPRQIVIGDSIWEVKFVRDIDNGRTAGNCDPNEQVISIRMGQCETERLKTFIHELFHAWEEEYGLEIPHKLIYRLEEPIVDFIQDNYLAG